MGGRGAGGVVGIRGRAIGGGGGGGAFTVTPNASGGVTITPNANNNANQQFTGGGSGVSDTNTHTTYFTPADVAIVSNSPVDGYRRSPRSGLNQPVGYYNTGDYYNINTELRQLGNGQRTRLTRLTQKVVDAMDRNMRPLNNDIDTVRWTDLRALSDNIGMPGASANSIIRAFQGGKEVTRVKADYTSSSYKASSNTVAGTAGRYVRVDMHYKKGALAQFSPTRKEGEMVGARGKKQRFANPRIQKAKVGGKYNQGHADILVIDCYVDD